MKNTALYIWRFQPTHNGHIDAIKQMIKAWLTNILIWIWSCEKHWTPDNPFSFEQRKTMLEISLSKSLVSDNICQILPVPDFDNDQVWSQYILDNFKDFGFVWTWNPHVKLIFENLWKSIIDLADNTNIKASNIRHFIYTKRVDQLQWLICEPQIRYIKDNNYPWNFNKMFYNILKPSLAVDWICKDKSWKLILIKRKNPPYGYALPWWFVDYWENPQEAVVRELSEELSIPQDSIVCEKLIWVYWSADRDPRSHVVSIVYQCILLENNIKAWDDATEVIRIDKSNLQNISLAFDHEKILKDYMIPK